jgi:hypothetical protein
VDVGGGGGIDLFFFLRQGGGIDLIRLDLN